MEAAIQDLVKVFLKSSKGKENLGKKEFQSLVKSQLSNILSDTDSKEAVNNMGQGLDADHDGKVGFQEYMKLVGYLACSLSDQRTLSKESGQNAASGQVAQTPQDKEEVKPEANAEAKEEAKPEASGEVKVDVPGIKVEANADPKVELKLDANAEPKVEVKLDANAEPKVEVKAEGVTVPEAAKEEEKTAAAAVEAAASSAKEAVKEGEEKATEKVEEAAEKLAAAAEEVEKKTEEATS
ncbi:S100 calcium binding protein U [Acanthopagrus latus]|uniref:S100 calcium binding protein U n=1 Tax=Acanthopagrus latus TaxID=8177 RepID=UPI00187CCCA5|nr:S100 calcium binding protein U [Acanthopagrus latus]XP_036949410.1 S100 calcium binding protein U [Acanthopagrus latus]